MGKPTICIGTDQLHSNREADQCLCFGYSDSTVPLLLKSEFQASSLILWLYRPVCVRPVQKLKLLVFSCTGSFDFHVVSFLF